MKLVVTNTCPHDSQIAGISVNPSRVYDGSSADESDRDRSADEKRGCPCSSQAAAAQPDHRSSSASTKVPEILEICNATMTVQPFTDDELTEMVEDAERALADLEAMLDLGPGPALPLLECVVCGEPVLARRLDARTCSSRCRQAAYRERLRNSPEVT